MQQSVQWGSNCRETTDFERQRIEKLWPCEFNPATQSGIVRLRGIRVIGPPQRCNSEGLRNE